MNVRNIQYAGRNQDANGLRLSFTADPVLSWGPNEDLQMQAMAAAGNGAQQSASIVMGHLPPGLMGTAEQALSLSTQIANAFNTYNQRHAAMPNFGSHLAFSVGMRLAQQAYAGTLNLHDAGAAVLTILGDLNEALQ